MKNEIILFVSQFALVFLLGFQSLNVRDNHFKSAASCSFLLGVSQAFQWRLMPKATPSEMAVWLCAGPIAIVLSIILHKRFFRRKP